MQYVQRELYTAYQRDIHSRRNQPFRDWLLDLIFNATYEKLSTGAPEKKIYKYSDHEPPFSMVAGDTVPYNVTNDD